MNEPKVLFWDLETLPDLNAVLKILPGLSNYYGLTLKASHNSIICFGYKWGHEDKAKIISAWDFPSWKKDVNDDKQLVIEARKIIEQADTIVTHNGKRFDLPFMQTRLGIHGLPLLHKINHVDTKNEYKKHMMLFNNKLDTVGKELLNDEKLENGGWDLWVNVHKRCKASMELMEKYCIQDVLLLEKAYKKIRHVVSSAPNHNLFGLHIKRLCPYCGSTRIKSHGYKVNKSTLYKRFRCIDCAGMFQVDKDGNRPKAL